MNFSEQMANRLKEARKNANISAADVGKVVNRSDKTIYAWENNISEPNAEQLIRLCRLYDVDISYFYPDDITNNYEITRLDTDEIELINCYRQVSPWERDLILNHAKMVLLHARK